MGSQPIRRLRIPAEALTVVALVAAQTALFARLVGTDTDYDEGVYLTSVDALEHGQRLGEDVFAPQPPVFYLLLRAISAAGADSVRGFQWGMVVLSVLTCLAAYALARALAGPVAGAIGSALLAVAPPFPLFAHRVLADVPPFGLALLALWLAHEARDRRSLYLAGAGGAALALAVGTKPNALLALPPFVVLLLGDRLGTARRLAAAGTAAVAVATVLALAYRDVLGQLWESVIVYHRDARATPAVIDKEHELLTFLDPRTPFAWFVVLGLLASLLLLVRRRETSGIWALWLWAAVSIVFLVVHHPLHYNHLLVLPVVLSVPAAVAWTHVATRLRGSRTILLLTAIALVAGYVQQHRRATLDDIPEERELIAAAEVVRERTRHDDLVVADHPIVAYLADRRVAGPLVDTARLRFQTGSLTIAKVLRELDAWNVRAVVAGRAFAERPRLMRALRQRYGDPVRVDDGIAIYLSR